MPIEKILSMLNTPEPIEGNKTTKDIRKENSYTHEILKDVKLLFEPEPIKENETVKDIRKENCNADKILRDRTAIFEPGEGLIFKKLKL